MAARRRLEREALYGVSSDVRGHPALRGDLPDLEDFLERHEVRAILKEPWNMYTWIKAGQSGALLGLGFVRGYNDRNTVILTRE